jgi:hypothetical protein
MESDIAAGIVPTWATSRQAVVARAGWGEEAGWHFLGNARWHRRCLKESVAMSLRWEGWFVVAAALFALASACSLETDLNPQPLPPGEDTGERESDESSAGAPGSGGEFGKAPDESTDAGTDGDAGGEDGEDGG